jgi:hypothetical protein
MFNYRTSLLKNKENVYLLSLISLETDKRSICIDFSKILGKPISTIIEGSICDYVTF